MRLGTRAFAAAIVVVAALPASAPAATQTNTQRLQDQINTTDIRTHLSAFQDIADANGGTRSTGTPGHELSAEYVIDQLESAPGDYWTVRSQTFVASVYTELEAPILTIDHPDAPTDWVVGTDFGSMEYSGAGVADAATVVVGFVEPTNQASASAAGCDPADFGPEVAGKIAVIQRGTCDFSVKAINAQNAGAVAAIIFNEGTLNDPERNGIINGTIGADNDYTIPVLDGSYEVGRFFVDHPGVPAHIEVVANTEDMPTRNVIADSPGGRTDRTVISGAHLDSVPEGPGINDDGSGSATQIEVALAMARLGISTRNHVRFIWFSGEEQGLFGSIYYADHLTKKERTGTSVMLDFDMLASPNYAMQIYDGDGSSFPESPGPNGSGAIERVFADFFANRPYKGSPSTPVQSIEFDGRSDYDEFTVVGIPAGGIATGAEVHKTTDEQALWGGVADLDPEHLIGQFDPCYHLECDSLDNEGIRLPGMTDNINDEALDITSDAVAHSVLTWAQTTSAANGTTQGSTQSAKDYEWKGDHRVK